MKTKNLYIEACLDSIEKKRFKTFTRKTLLSLSATKNIMSQNA